MEISADEKKSNRKRGGVRTQDYRLEREPLVEGDPGAGKGVECGGK